MGLVVVTPGRAMACSCIGTTPIEALGRADAAFIGTVVARRRPPMDPDSTSLDPMTLTFTVDAVFKGTVRRRQQIVTASAGASCGLEVQDRATYLVFGSKKGMGGPPAAPGQYAANLCNGTIEAQPGDRPRGFPAPRRPVPEHVSTADRRGRSSTHGPATAGGSGWRSPVRRMTVGLGVLTALAAIAAIASLRRRV